MVQQTVKVLAIPIDGKNSKIKIISLNQTKDRSTNGYKEFGIHFGLQSEENQSDLDQSIKYMRKVINVEHITILSLRNCELDGIPSHIAYLPLTELDLTKNNLNHVPECLYFGLQYLEVLNLSFNPIQDFQLAPKCVENLKILNIKGCNFGNVPIWIQEMKAIQLEDFNYSDNYQRELKRQDRPPLPSKLRKLVFCNSKLRQNMLDFFKRLSLLQYLDIGNTTNVCTDKKVNVILDLNQFLTDVSWLSHIQVLKLNDLNLQEMSGELSKMVKLQELYLKQNCLISIPSTICALQELVILDISYNCLYTLPDLIGLQKLEELHLTKNHLSSIRLLNLPRLRYLDLYDNDLDSIQIDVTSIDAIDFEQNARDAGVLMDTIGNFNYNEKRDHLRFLRSKMNKDERLLGGKITLDLGSPIDDLNGMHYFHGEDDWHYDASNEVYSDYEEDDGLKDSGVLLEDNEEEDWGDYRSSHPVDLVTLSDSEFQPEIEAKPVDKTNCLENIDEGIDTLFINAD